MARITGLVSPDELDKLQKMGYRVERVNPGIVDDEYDKMVHVYIDTNLYTMLSFLYHLRTVTEESQI